MDLGPIAQTPRHLSDAFGRNKSTFPLAGFRPRIGIKNSDSTKTRVRKRTQNCEGVAIKYPDILKIIFFDRREKFRNAVNERLAAYKAHARIELRIAHKVLSASEADLQPKIVLTGQQVGVSPQIFRSDPQTREERLGKRGLPSAKRLAFASPKKMPFGF